MDKFRTRNFCLVLYPLEDISHKKAIDFIKLNYDYALITHDRDLDDNNQLKKSHVHIVISFSNAKWNTALAEELDIPINYIQKCRNYCNALEYLIHYNDEDKIKYEIEEVTGTLTRRLRAELVNDDKTESEKILELFDYIDSYEGFIDYRVFYRYCCTIGRWDVMRRATMPIKDYIDGHNKEI